MTTSSYFRDRQVIYVSSVDISVGDGPGVNEREFVGVLAEQLGPHLHVVIPKPRRPVELPLHASLTPTLSRNPLSLFRHLSAQYRATRDLLETKPIDLIIYRLSPYPITPYLISRRYATPYAVKTLGYGVVARWAERYGLIGKLLLAGHRPLLRYVIRHAVALDTVGDRSAATFAQIFDLERGRMISIDNAVNTNRFYPQDKAAVRALIGVEHLDPIIGYVGGEPADRGAMQLIKIAPRLIEEYPSLGVLIVGPSNRLEEFKTIVQQTGISDHCLITGQVPYDDVPTYINCLDVGVSLNLKFEISQFSLGEQKIRQYIACGKPVICGPGGNEFVVEHSLGAIVDPIDLDAIQAQIEYWLSRLAENAAGHAELATHFAVEKLSTKNALGKRLLHWETQLRKDNHTNREHISTT